MSRLDEYEQRRGPVRRFRRSGPSKPRQRQAQLALRLVGGASAKELADLPFDDDISQIGARVSK